MSYTRYKNVKFGPKYAGAGLLTHVGYALDGDSGWTVASEKLGPGSVHVGCAEATVTFPDGYAGGLMWTPDSTANPPVVLLEEINPGDFENADAKVSSVPGSVWTNGNRTLSAFAFSVFASNAPTNWSSLVISTGGLVAIDTSKTFAARNQDAVTAPTIADALQGSWENNYGVEAEDDVAATWTKKLPDKSGPSRTFPLTLNSNGDPVARG